MTGDGLPNGAATVLNNTLSFLAILTLSTSDFVNMGKDNTYNNINNYCAVFYGE